MVLLDELLLLFDTTFASDEKEDHQDHNKSQRNDTPDDDIGAHSSLGAPEQEGDHQAKTPSDNADNEDRIFENFYAS